MVQTCAPRLNHAASAEVFECGDRVGLRFGIGSERDTLCADAIFRHCRRFEPRDEKVLMGFQFVDLKDTPQGRQTLDVLTRRIEQLQRACGIRP